MADTSAPEQRIGEVVDGRYRIVEHIASGGMAAVYRAEHVNTRVSFAVKVLHPELSGNPEVAARFQREVQACRRVQHPHVVVAIDFGSLPDGCLFMVLEFTPGEDLFLLLHRTKPLAPERAVKIALQVALALVAAHAAGVVHRDLKPDNIMLIARDGDPDFVKVVDFGIAKLPVRGQALTVLGSVFGTPEYMAPEQARGVAVDARTDLYTLGVVLYEMLSGVTPFASKSIADLIVAQISRPPPPLPASVDPELAALVSRLLEKDPSARPQSAGEVAATLHRVLWRIAPGHPVLASPAVVQFARAPSLPPPALTAAPVPGGDLAPALGGGPAAGSAAPAAASGGGFTPALGSAPPPAPSSPPMAHGGSQAPVSYPAAPPESASGSPITAPMVAPPPSVYSAAPPPAPMNSTAGLLIAAALVALFFLAAGIGILVMLLF